MSTQFFCTLQSQGFQSDTRAEGNSNGVPTKWHSDVWKSISAQNWVECTDGTDSVAAQKRWEEPSKGGSWSHKQRHDDHAEEEHGLTPQHENDRAEALGSSGRYDKPRQHVAQRSV